MNVISSHIRYLLVECGHVAVPGLGVFSVAHIPAAYTDCGMNAPCDSLTFVHDDMCDGSTLIASVARTREISVPEALALVSADVREWNHALSLGTEVCIDGVGCISAHDGSLVFSEAPDFVGSRSLAWLDSLELQPIIIERADTATDDSEVRRQEAFMRSIRRTASSAAAIAIMVLIAFIASQMPKPAKSSEAQYASLPIEPIAGMCAADRETLIEHPGASADKSLVLILNTPADATADATPRQASELQTVQEARYCLVVASLYSADEASRYIEASKDAASLSLLEKDGHYRVYITQGPTIEAVQTEARATGLYDRYPSAWICRK